MILQTEKNSRSVKRICLHESILAVKVQASNFGRFGRIERKTALIPINILAGESKTKTGRKAATTAPGPDHDRIGGDHG